MTVYLKRGDSSWNNNETTRNIIVYYGRRYDEKKIYKPESRVSHILHALIENAFSPDTSL